MKLGQYELKVIEEERINWFHTSDRITVPSDIYIVRINDQSGFWELKVCLPVDASVSGAVSLHRPLTLTGPLSQVVTKSMKLSVVRRRKGMYISELKLCKPENTGRMRCRQIRIDEQIPLHFSTSGIKAVEYAAYVDSRRSNSAMGWLCRREEVEKMALCFYLSRIFPLI